MNLFHPSVPWSRRWRRWLPLAIAAGAGGTALVIWFEELIAFAIEIITCSDHTKQSNFS
jgi:hypothetical protein